MYNDYKNQFVAGKVIVALDRSIDSMNNPEYLVLFSVKSIMKK